MGTLASGTGRMFEQESWPMWMAVSMGGGIRFHQCDSQMDSRYASVSNTMARTTCSTQSRVPLRLDNAFRFIDRMTAMWDWARNLPRYDPWRQLAEQCIHEGFGGELQ